MTSPILEVLEKVARNLHRELYRSFCQLELIPGVVMPEDVFVYEDSSYYKRKRWGYYAFARRGQCIAIGNVAKSIDFCLHLLGEDWQQVTPKQLTEYGPLVQERVRELFRANHDPGGDPETVFDFNTLPMTKCGGCE